MYTFAAIPQGNYTVTATAGSSYQSQSQTVSVGSGQTVSVTLPLTTAEEEGEGEGQVEQFVLTLAVEGSGTLNPPVGANSHASGAQVSVTATPEDGWDFDAWQGAATGRANPVTVIMDADQTLTAVFSRGGCGCGKSAPGLPGPGETFVAALTLLVMTAFGTQYRPRNKGTFGTRGCNPLSGRMVKVVLWPPRHIVWIVCLIRFRDTLPEPGRMSPWVCAVSRREFCRWC